MKTKRAKRRIIVKSYRYVGALLAVLSIVAAMIISAYMTSSDALILGVFSWEFVIALALSVVGSYMVYDSYSVRV